MPIAGFKESTAITPGKISAVIHQKGHSAGLKHRESRLSRHDSVSYPDRYKTENDRYSCLHSSQILLFLLSGIAFFLSSLSLTRKLSVTRALCIWIFCLLFMPRALCSSARTQRPHISFSEVRGETEHAFPAKAKRTAHT